ncbi:MAG: putative sulfate exporter family transporter [Nitriliruptoraceae bacterium]
MTVRTDRLRELLPGLAIAAVGMVAAQAAASVSAALSPIVVAMVVGIVARNAGAIPERADAGLSFAARTLLRVGIVLLGFRLAIGDVLTVGAQAVGIVVALVGATLVFTTWLGRRLGLPRDLAVLTGTGFAICGATAVAAMREVVDADDDSSAFAVSLVTIFGTISIALLPAVALALGMADDAFGQWVGASVHDVGQVVVTAAALGTDAVAVAVVVKLVRVLMLAPILLGVGMWWRRSAPDADASARPALVPGFIVGFLLAVAARTSGVLSDEILAVLRSLEGWMFTIALVGLGAGVRLARLRNVGGRALLLGVIAYVLVAGIALGGVALVYGAAGVTGG